MRSACDTHIHFYDHRHPVAPAATLRPPDATPDDYRDVQAALGAERIVVVQPTTYGLDNTCQLDAMTAFGDAARGVMVVDANVGRTELARLTTSACEGPDSTCFPAARLPGRCSRRSPPRSHRSDGTSNCS
jgi:D-galactarolactone isomerase